MMPPHDGKVLHHNDSGSTQLSSSTSYSSGSQILGPRSNLDEVAAPPPIYESAENLERQQEFLESRHSQDDRGSLPLHQETEPAQLYTQDAGVPDTPNSSKKRTLWKILRKTCIIGYLIFFSIAGTVLRLAIECLTFYPGTPVNTSVLWANVGGSFIMGFLSQDQKLFRVDDSHTAQAATNHKKTIPLYIGLATGFCGSLTSFSTFIRDAFLALSNDLAVPLGSYSDTSLFTSVPAGAKAPNGGFSFMAIVAVLLTEIGLSVFSLFLGAHLAIGTSAWMPTLPQRWVYKFLDPLVSILAILSWVAVICLAALFSQGTGEVSLWSTEMWKGPTIFALIFAPLGTLVRFFISLKLNGRIASFPLGTFVVNMSGTMILGMAYSLQHASFSGASFAGCQILQGIMDGFCGCLTTVSTWVLELSGLRKRHAYFYAALSVVVALCALVIEIGSLKWTQGLDTPLCFRDI
ncbi:hypothetical protein N7507_005926 [Penicillium longicatenatum]|nr:hypothetical protein N7507_005926 [Penicillium longicatenatum]